MSAILTVTFMATAPGKSPAPVGSPTPPATRMMLLGDSGTASAATLAQIASAKTGLEGAVSEIDACCQGQLETAPMDSQRRWAVSLYRWLVLTGCNPDPKGFAVQSRFEAQARRLDPGYVAALAAHPAGWLEQNKASLPSASLASTQTTPQLFSGVCVLGIFEQELRRAVDKRDAAVRSAEAELKTAASSVATDRGWARERLNDALSKGVAFDREAAFRQQRESLAAQLKEREDKIKAVQDENAEYQSKWTEKNGRLAYGTLDFQKAIGEYRRVVNQHNDQLLALGGEITELQRKIDRLQGGALNIDLVDLDLPPAARAVPQGAPTEPAPAKPESSPTRAPPPTAASPTPATLLERP